MLSRGLPRFSIFSTLSHKFYDLKKKLLITKCVLISAIIFVWNILHSKKNWGVLSEKCFFLNVMYPLFLCDFNENWIFATSFQWILSVKFHFKKLVLWDQSFSMRTAEWTYGRADGRTDMTKVIVAFAIFHTLPKQCETNKYTQSVNAEFSNTKLYGTELWNVKTRISHNM
jgi:hypothetical protein